MSDSGKSKSEILSQDLEHSGVAAPSSRAPFSDKEQESRDASLLNESDRSLSSIHTGSRDPYDAGTDSVLINTNEEKPIQSDGYEGGENVQGAKLTHPEIDSLNSAPDAREDTAEFTLGSAVRDTAQTSPSSSLLAGTQLDFADQDTPEETNFYAQAEGGNSGVINPAVTVTAKTEVAQVVDEAAHSVALTNDTIAEDASVGDVVGTVSAIDPEGGALSYSLSDNAGGKFSIDAATGEIKVAGALDHETADSYTVIVDVNDGTQVTQQTFTLGVSDVDEAAHSVALTNDAIAEDASVGDVVGTVSAIDPEGGALSYSLSDNAGGKFSIDATTGEIKVAGALDHETADSYTVTVDVHDGTQVTQQTFTLGVSDVDEAAHSVALTNDTIAEDASVGDVVGTVSAIDPEGGALSYSLSDNADGKFTIDATTGEIKVAGALDHETADSYTVIVDVNDGTQVTQQTFTLGVSDVDEAAHSVALTNDTIAEDASVGDVVGTVSAIDPEGGALSYSLSDNAGGKFSIDATTGEIKVAGALDHETSDSYTVTVDVNDGTQVTQQTFTLGVSDVDEAAHSVALTNDTIAEDASVGDVVGTVSAIDPEGGALSYSLSDNAGGKFSIDATTGEIKVAGALDHETADSYTVTVDVNDGTQVTQQTFTLGVSDVNEASSLSGRGNIIQHEEVGEVADLSHMDAFPELNSGGDLENRVGTEVFGEMISDAEKLVINYQTDATVTFQGEIAGYRNTIGAYQINTDGSIKGVQMLWGDASSDKLQAGVSTATYEGIEAGSELGFFVISNGYGSLPAASVSGDGNTISETGSWMFVSPDFDPNTQNPADHSYNVNEDSGPPKMIFVEDDGTIHTQSGNIFHSLNQFEFNPENDATTREHFVAGVDQENGILNFGFEDLLGGGDNDFNDGMFSVEIDARDIVDVPNPLFSNDENGHSTFQLNDVDSDELSQVIVVLGDIQAGDSLSISGGYNLVGDDVCLPTGAPTGISVSFADDGSTITATFTGAGSVGAYESVIQNLNFSNTDPGDVSGARSISVVVTDDGGEQSSTMFSSLSVNSEFDNPNAYQSNDDMQGTEGADAFYGGSGHDQFSGGAGDDLFHFGSNDGNDTFIGGDGGGWSDTIVLTDGIPAGDVGDWLNLTSGHVESMTDGEVFLSDDAAGTISLGDEAVLTFEGVEKIEC